jgi:hypothetical protein
MVMSNQIFPDSSNNQLELTNLGQEMLFEEIDIWNFEKRTQSPDPPDPPVIPDTLRERERLFRVYPNPIGHNGELTIIIKDEMVGKIKFKLFDISGRVVSEFQPTSNSVIIPRNKFPAAMGLFFLKGTTGQFTRTEKLLILQN